MRNTLLLLTGLLCFWGYQMNVDENLTAMYEKRDNTEEVDRQLHILTAKVSKTYSDLFSGIQIMPWKGNVYIELPLDLSGEVKRITKNSATHDDKLLAIYRWVTTHIEYDNDYKIYNEISVVFICMYKGRKTSCIKDLNNFGTILFMFPKYFMLNAQIFL